MLICADESWALCLRFQVKTVSIYSFVTKLSCVFGIISHRLIVIIDMFPRVSGFMVKSKVS